MATRRDVTKIATLHLKYTSPFVNRFSRRANKYLLIVDDSESTEFGPATAWAGFVEIAAGRRRRFGRHPGVVGVCTTRAVHVGAAAITGPLF